MLRNRITALYLEGDFNCAESILLAANAEYHLGLSPKDIRLVSGFGGGMGCGSTCGALAGGVAVLGALLVNRRAHTTEGFKEACAGWVEAFSAILGSERCDVVKEKYANTDQRCLKTVLLAAGALESYLRDNGYTKSSVNG
ncbi:MAG: hypothetical protein GX650_07790 [Clostridiales bacterium]|nr:hypothetical protein [Clostridiales bacterium]